MSRRTPRFFNIVACRPDSFDSIEWLRYYIDFCQRYNFRKKEKESFAVFVEKLKGKEQAEGLGTQAHHAVSFFYGMDQWSAEKVKNDIPPAVKDTISEQASIEAAYWHTKEPLPNQAVLYLHMITVPTTRPSGAALLGPAPAQGA